MNRFIFSGVCAILTTALLTPLGAHPFLVGYFTSMAFSESWDYYTRKQGLIFPIEKFIEQWKQGIVKKRYYNLHAQIFTANTEQELEGIAKKVAMFYYAWVGYVDKVFLVGLMENLDTSIRNQQLAITGQYRTDSWTGKI